MLLSETRGHILQLQNTAAPCFPWFGGPPIARVTVCKRVCRCMPVRVSLCASVRVAVCQCASLYGSARVTVCGVADPQVHVDAAYVEFPPGFDVSGLRRLKGLPGQVGPCLDVELGMSPTRLVGKRVSAVLRCTVQYPGGPQGTVHLKWVSTALYL